MICNIEDEKAIYRNLNIIGHHKKEAAKATSFELYLLSNQTNHQVE